MELPGREHAGTEGSIRVIETRNFGIEVPEATPGTDLFESRFGIGKRIPKEALVELDELFDGDDDRLDPAANAQARITAGLCHRQRQIAARNRIDDFVRFP